MLDDFKKFALRGNVAPHREYDGVGLGTAGHVVFPQGDP
jgi:hypothetical protein